jgi:hypothetical protein
MTQTSGSDLLDRRAPSEDNVGCVAGWRAWMITDGPVGA